MKFRSYTKVNGNRIPDTCTHAFETDIVNRSYISNTIETKLTLALVICTRDLLSGVEQVQIPLCRVCQTLLVFSSVLGKKSVTARLGLIVNIVPISILSSSSFLLRMICPLAFFQTVVKVEVLPGFIHSHPWLVSLTPILL